jgi:hypothetical protein
MEKQGKEDTSVMTMTNRRILIRRDVKNKNKWVFEIYYADALKHCFPYMASVAHPVRALPIANVNGTTVWRTFPNVISSRYLTKNDAQEGAERFLNTGKLDWNDQTKRTPYDWNEKRALRKVRA